MSTIRAPCGRSVRFRPQPLNLASTLTYSKSDMPEMRCPRFRDSQEWDAGALCCPDALVNANHARINTLALGSRLATMLALRDYIGAGGLICCGAGPTDLFRRAGGLRQAILKGAKPADLPIEQPTKFELVINLTTAKALGLQSLRSCSRAPTR